MYAFRLPIKVPVHSSVAHLLRLKNRVCSKISVVVLDCTLFLAQPLIMLGGWLMRLLHLRTGKLVSLCQKESESDNTA